MAQEPLSASTRRAEIRQTLQTRLISEPLRTKIDADLASRDVVIAEGAVAAVPTRYEVIIELNLNNPAGRVESREAVLQILRDILGPDAATALARNRPDSIHPYVFASLTAEQILETVMQDEDRINQHESSQTKTDVGRTEFPQSESGFPSVGSLQAPPSLPGTSPLVHRIQHPMRSIFRIWESQKIHPLTTESIRTVKANAAHSSFSALGEKIVWAVMDSGVDATHPHFVLHNNLGLDAPLTNNSCSFSGTLPWDQDAFGHGTHVAGIIAGEADPDSTPQAAIQAEAASGDTSYHLEPVPGIKGMAPRAKLLILRVLDDNGDGDETALIQAIEYVQQLNDYGRHVVVHGVNISAGFPAHPTWYACGQTPLCLEINRLVKCGVVVVVAAGNSGHVVTFLNPVSTTEAGQMLSINDPGNASLAITVGSTHRLSPHTFGVSYFSSKGPTSDGRKKPEVVAPGEKIISAASSQKAASIALAGLNRAHFGYMEDTGTSMAAPHVSGVLAAFLSVKREYIGQPEKTRDLLMQSSMDLGRDPNFQGSGLVDLMKLIQSI
jgi:serine protease AprX